MPSLRSSCLIGATAVALMAGACSLGISTSDYVGGPPVIPVGEGGGIPDTFLPEGAVPPAGHVGIFGGIRDILGPGDNYTFLTETLFATIDGSGNIGAWTEARPLPFGGGITPTVQSGTVFGFGNLAAVSYCCQLSLEWAPFDAGVTGPWHGESQMANVPPAPDGWSNLQLFGKAAWAFGGEGSPVNDAGVGVFTVYPDVFTATFDPTTQVFGAWQPSPNPLTVARSRLTVFAHGGYVYVIGGMNNGYGAMPDFEYATLSAAGDSIGPFTALAQPTDPLTKKALATTGPAIATTSDTVYLIGGATDGGGYTPTNFVTRAHFHADGTIDPWVAGPNLPTALRGAGAFATNGILYVLGGQVTATSRSDQVLTAHIQADGSLDGWQAQPTYKLPSSRSDFGILTY